MPVIHCNIWKYSQTNMLLAYKREDEADKRVQTEWLNLTYTKKTQNTRSDNQIQN